MSDLDISRDVLLLVALGGIALVAIVNSFLLIALRMQMTRLRREHAEQIRVLRKEATVAAPLRAAVAVKLATGRQTPVTYREFETELRSLSEKWDEVESLAAKAHDQLAGLAEKQDRPDSARQN